MTDPKPLPGTSNASVDQATSQPDWVRIVPGGAVTGVVRPPGSKSLTNRALLCAAFADGVSTLHGVLRSEDTAVMIDSLAKIGVGIDPSDGGLSLRVRPAEDGFRNRRENEPIEMFVGNSGTTVRFLTAALSALGGHYQLFGVDRMHQRPIADLTDAIASVIEGSAEPRSGGGCPPVLIRSEGWKNQSLSVAGHVSSQYLSGLMMAGPIATGRKSAKTNVNTQVHGDQDRQHSSSRQAPDDEHASRVEIHVKGELVSLPYVEMTARVMQDFGAAASVIHSESGTLVRVTGDGYRGADYQVEPDASAASYFWAAAAITGGCVRVNGLHRDAIQGDVAFAEVLRQMGCEVRYTSDSITVDRGDVDVMPLTGIDVNMNAISDTVQTLAVVALFANSPTRVRGVAHNRYKETDRIGDLATELRKLGAEVDEHQDGLTITPLDLSRDATAATRDATDQTVLLDTYDDHRMAMSLSLAGLRLPGVAIANPACTSKTYPNFFADLEKLIGRPHHWA